MDDVSKVRPQDLGSNTAKHLIESPEVKIWPTLEVRTYEHSKF